MAFLIELLYVQTLASLAALGRPVATGAPLVDAQVTNSPSVVKQLFEITFLL